MFEDSFETRAFERWGGPGGTEIENVVDGVGVTSRPLAKANDGVIVMVPATVPVCKLIWLLPPGKMACVVFGGMVKATARPPLAN